MTLRRLVPLLFVVGLVLTVSSLSTVLLIAGVLCLVAFVVCGLFAIATPAYLGDDDDPREEPGDRAPELSP